MSRRCVLLFARPPREEARIKGLAHAEVLFHGTCRRIRSAVAALPEVDLFWAPQNGTTFGERLQNAFAEARRRGYDEVVAVPGDVPGLDAGRLARAFAALEEGRLVLGPCPDGGVYLIGSAEPVAALFCGVRWRTRFVLPDLQERCPEALLLPPLADVDRPEDLGRVLADPDLDPALRALIHLIRRRRSPRLPDSPVRPRPILLHSSAATRAPPSFA